MVEFTLNDCNMLTEKDYCDYSTNLSLFEEALSEGIKEAVKSLTNNINE